MRRIRPNGCSSRQANIVFHDLIISYGRKRGASEQFVTPSEPLEVLVEVSTNADDLIAENKPLLRLLVTHGPEIPFLVRGVRKEHLAQDAFLQLRVIIFVEIVAQNVTVAWRVVFVDVLQEIIRSVESHEEVSLNDKEREETHR
jgi:hypothetical protein